MTPGTGGEADAPARDKPPTVLRPGVIFANRYKILRRLGKGGMGEVFSAQDLSLRDTVALKVSRGEASWHLIHEVKAARNVSHPNVCRVHEVDSFEGRLYLSMQLIQGETLGDVLQRTVGDLTAKERLHFAHDLCAGLGAVHDAGVLHRDLKPSNVMLDVSGRAIVTDFGIAAATREVPVLGAGTPEYMAPELFSGGGTSFASDVYALGLVLYELFVGRRAFEEGSKAEEARRRGEKVTLTFPPDRQVPHQVQEIVIRCLEPDTADRPATVAVVAALLPPRPPLQSDRRDTWIVPPETLLVTPNPEPRPARARWLLLAFLLALLSVAGLDTSGPWTRPLAGGEKPEVLEMRARDLIAEAGFDSEPRTHLSGFTATSRRPGEEHPLTSDDPWVFWYWQSPGRWEPTKTGTPFHRYREPSTLPAGAVGVHLDLEGRLLRLAAHAVRRDAEGPPIPPPDWQPFFDAAGMPLEGSEPTSPRFLPPTFADHRIAHTFPKPPGAGEGVQVEAASFRGQPVWFSVFEGLGAPASAAAAADRMPVPSRLVAWLLGLWLTLAIFGAAAIARRNLRRRLADPNAALRLAAVVFGGRMLVWALGCETLPGPTRLPEAEAHLARSLLAAALVWLVYICLEPAARRFLPLRTASWVRLVYGRANDPLVGRDLLVGALIGVAAVLWARLYGAVAFAHAASGAEAMGSLAWIVGQPALNLPGEALRGVRQALAMQAYALVHATIFSFFGALGVVALRSLAPRVAISRAAAFLILLAVLYPAAGHPAADLVAAAVASALWLLSLIRFGFLTTVTATLVAWLLGSHPLTLDPDAWYVHGSALVMLTVAAIGIYGFWISLAGEPIFPKGMNRLSDSPGHAT